MLPARQLVVFLLVPWRLSLKESVELGRFQGRNESKKASREATKLTYVGQFPLKRKLQATNHLSWFCWILRFAELRGSKQASHAKAIFNRRKCNKFLWKNWQEILVRQCCKSWRSDPDMCFFLRELDRGWLIWVYTCYMYRYIHIMVYVEKCIYIPHYTYKFSVGRIFSFFFVTFATCLGPWLFESRLRAICSQRVVIRPSTSSSCWKMAQKCLSGWHMACIFRSLYVFFFF